MEAEPHQLYVPATVSLGPVPERLQFAVLLGSVTPETRPVALVCHDSPKQYVWALKGFVAGAVLCGP